MTVTLSIYIARRFLLTALSAFLAVLALVMIVDLVELLRANSAGRAGFADLIGMALLHAPSITITAAPFTVLLAAMTAFASLARSSELVVTRASGVSVWALLAPAVIAAAVLGVLSFTVYNPIAAAFATKFDALEQRYFNRTSSSLSVSASGLWLRQGDGAGQTVIRAQRASGAVDRLWEVSVFQFDADDRFARRIEARRAVLEDGLWRMNLVRIWDMAPGSAAGGAGNAAPGGQMVAEGTAADSAGTDGAGIDGAEVAGAGVAGAGVAGAAGAGAATGTAAGGPTGTSAGTAGAAAAGDLAAGGPTGTTTGTAAGAATGTAAGAATGTAAGAATGTAAGTAGAAGDARAETAAVLRDELTLATDLTPERIQDSFSPPNTISFWQLPGFIALLDQSGFSSSRHLMHYYSLLAAPVVFVAMVLIGAAFSMRHVRFGGLGVMALGCVLSGFGYFFLSDIAGALGASGAVPVVIAAWAPPISAILFALGLLLHLEDG